MSESSEAKDYTESIFEYQVAGHRKILRHPTNSSLLLKPSNSREAEFYQKANLKKLDICKHMAPYFGLDEQKRLIMADLTFGMPSPFILDIKIGKRLYGINAAPGQILRRIKKSAETSSGKFGFRVCGIRLGKFGIQDKLSLSKFNKNELQTLFSCFYRAAPELRMSTILVLKDIRRLIQSSSIQLISSSILLIYDESKPSNIICKLIDFAHSHLHEEFFLDRNYLEALENFIKILEYE